MHAELTHQLEACNHPVIITLWTYAQQGYVFGNIVCTHNVHVPYNYLPSKVEKKFFLNHREGDDYNSGCEPLILLQCTNLGFQVYQASLELCNVLWRFDNGRRAL